MRKPALKLLIQVFGVLLSGGLVMSGAGLAQAAPTTSAVIPKPAAAENLTTKAPAGLPSLAKNAEVFGHGRFDTLIAYRPQGTPNRIVMFFSGDDGWNSRAEDFAQTLAAKGALVIGIDTRQILATMEADGASCQFLDGDLENLSHFVQAYYQMPGYAPPLLAGYDAGGALAYAMIVQGDMFGGALSIAFTPALNLHKPLCAGSGLEFSPSDDGVIFKPSPKPNAPWVVLQGSIDQFIAPAGVQQFVSQVPGAQWLTAPGVGHSFSQARVWTAALQDAYDKLVSAQKPQIGNAAPADLGNLPVVEVPAKAGAAQSDTLALLMSGDGGWAGLDQEVAGALSAQGIPVIGLDSLRYYWSPRTPEGVARDVDKILRYYLNKLGKKKVLLVGYSQGADVLPFVLNRLPPATRAQISLGVVMGLSEHALFEFHLSSWVSDAGTGLATLPEVSRIDGTPLLCIYGDGEDDTLCPKLDPQKVKVVKLPGGHHFDGNYERLAQEILSAAR